MAVLAPSGRDYGRATSVDTALGMLKIYDPDTLAQMLYSSASRGRDEIHHRSFYAAHSDNEQQRVGVR